MPHTLDTNILIYSVDEKAGHKHDVAKAIVTASANGDGILTLQVLGEFFYATTRKGILPPSLAFDYVEDWRTVFEIIAADEEVLSTAMRFVIDHHLSFWDAVLCATTSSAGCVVLYSEDMQYGRALGGVEIVNPLLT